MKGKLHTVVIAWTPTPTDSYNVYMKNTMSETLMGSTAAGVGQFSMDLRRGDYSFVVRSVRDGMESKDSNVVEVIV